jgi:hypothetical protein
MTESTKHFGQIELKGVERYYETEVELNGRSVEITINITGSGDLESNEVKRVDAFVDDLENHIEALKNIFLQDFKNEGETKNYIDSQIREENVLGIEAATGNVEALISALYPVRINFYPEKDDEMFAMFDFTLNETISEDILALKIYKNNQVQIGIES